MSKPTASSPQTTLADVEQRIVAAAKEREEAATEGRSQARRRRAVGRQVSAAVSRSR